jgi:anti-sigma B factor antagonist
MTTPSARPETIELALRPDGADASVVGLAGDLDESTHAQVLSLVDSLLAGGRIHLVLDLSSLRFCDSTGLGTLVRAHRLAVRSGGSLRLCGPGPQLRRMLAVTNLDRLLPVDDAVDDGAPSG